MFHDVTEGVKSMTMIAIGKFIVEIMQMMSP